MQEEREHKGLFGMVRSFMIEDAPEDDRPSADEHQAGSLEPRARAAGGSDDVDKMFSDIEAEVAAKPGKPGKPGKPAKAGVAAGEPGTSTPNPTTGAAFVQMPGAPVAVIPGDILPTDVQKVVKLIDALPAVLTPEQVRPLLAATMEAASLNAQTVAQQVVDSKRQAQESIGAANNEIARLESEREETLARLVKLMDAARSQCAEGVAAQQSKIAGLTAALNTLARVSAFVDGVAAPDGMEKKP